MAKLNPTCPEVSDMFCGLMNAASSVFAYHLMLGGTYSTTANGLEILKHLTAIQELIKDFDQKVLEVYADQIKIIK